MCVLGEDALVGPSIGMRGQTEYNGPGVTPRTDKWLRLTGFWRAAACTMTGMCVHVSVKWVLRLRRYHIRLEISRVSLVHQAEPKSGSVSLEASGGHGAAG